MKYGKLINSIFIFLLGGIASVSIALFFNNCSGFQSSSNGNPTDSADSQLGAPQPINGTEPYAVPIIMEADAFNIPTVTITVCSPGSTTDCQTIPNILLDTGSTGLRIFSSVLSIGWTQFGNYAECYQFGAGWAFWGPVSTADVTLGGETISGLEFQVGNANYAAAPSDCTLDANNNPYTLATGPGQDYQWNGILGVQEFSLDCGENCDPGATSATYYTCSGSTCSDYTMPPEDQVPNPIAALPNDNNGYSIQTPNIPLSGADNLSGAYLVLGIGTEADNQPSPGVHAIGVDSTGCLNTVFQGNTFQISFIDSGSFFLSFPDSTGALQTCNLGDNADPFFVFCPSSPISLTASLQGADGQGNVTIPFPLYNGETALNDPNNFIFSDVGVPEEGLNSDGYYFDWGLPLFFGKTIYFGMDTGTVPNLGEGPFNAM